MFEIVIELLRFSKSILISKSINNIAIIIESSVLYLNINSFISATIVNAVWIIIQPISLGGGGVERFVNDKLFILNWISFFMENRYDWPTFFKFMHKWKKKIKLNDSQNKV